MEYTAQQNLVVSECGLNWLAQDFVKVTLFSYQAEEGGVNMPNHAKPVKLIVGGPTEASKADSAFWNVIKIIAQVALLVQCHSQKSSCTLHTDHTNPAMSSWSVEAIIAFVTLLATCIPILVLLLRNFMPHRRVVQSEASMSFSPLRFGLLTNTRRRAW
jgi:hypothetical protein